MADTLSLSISAGIDWTFADALDLSTIQDNASLSYAEDMADGTGSGQADKIWHDTRTVSAGSNDDLDLSALTQTVFGSTVTTEFARIKAILIVNKDETSGDDIRLDSSVSNSILTPFGGSATTKVQVPAGSPLLMANRIAGWAVTAGTADILRIANPGANDVEYDIVIVGTSA